MPVTGPISIAPIDYDAPSSGVADSGIRADRAEPNPGAGQTLFDLLNGRNLMLYPAADMRKQALRTVAVESSRGWRIAKEKTSHKIDSIVALAMECRTASDAGPRRNVGSIGIKLSGFGTYYFPDENGHYPWNKPIDWPHQIPPEDRADPAWQHVARTGGRAALEQILRERGRL